MSHKILILDDEPIIADDLGFMLEDAGFEVVAKAANAKMALEVLSTSPVDLALLDVNLESDTSGTDVAREIINKYQLPFIFITSYTDQTTLSEIEDLNPSAYISKPYQSEQVVLAVKLALKKQSNFRKEKKVPTKIFVRDSGVLKPINPQDLMVASGEDNYTRLRMVDGKEYMISHTLKTMESKLPESSFCRVHKSSIINLHHIMSIEGNTIELKQMTVSIGKAYRDRLFQHLEIL